ncbi:MAG: hypothetical protein IPM38_00160 [Ignavibacteria bacterium]|nr:hypothetical protein [Ignavibacteria bacterium]
MSTIHKTNLPQTCGNCHPGATLEILITSKIHLTDLKEDSPWGILDNQILYYIDIRTWSDLCCIIFRITEKEEIENRSLIMKK